MNPPEQTFYWFDYETFGTSPAWDRPAQFAGQRTTLELEPVGEPLIIYCKPADDYLPNPYACRVTGLQPQQVYDQGLPEALFIDQVVAELGKPGTCSVGYNSIRFDDEFTRHTLFRNFHDAYQQEWKDGNSRWDLLDVVRLARALRPDGIQWPFDEQGKPVNRLELITKANDIEHGNAHDALADVVATIAVARLLRTHQKKLFDFAFTHRDKQSAASILNVKNKQACLHISGMVPATTLHTSIIVPLARHPVNQNQVIVLDMRTDPETVLKLSSEQIASRVFVSNNDLGDEQRIHLRTIQINRCPVLVPVSTMRKEDAERIGIDMELQLQRAEFVKRHFDDAIAERVRIAMTREWAERNADSDGTLYSGAFFGAADKERFANIRSGSPELLGNLEGLFDDARADEMLFRYRARNYPESLTDEERDLWSQFVRQRLTDDEAPWLSANRFMQLMNEIPWEAAETPLKNSLLAWSEKILESCGENLPG